MADRPALRQTDLLLIQPDAAGPGRDAVAILSKPDWRLVDAANRAADQTAALAPGSTLRSHRPDHMGPLAPRPPARIQRRRTAGWRMPVGAVYVGRPTIWGNPFDGSRWDDDDWPLGRFPDHRACAAECYRRWLLDDPAFMGWYRGTLAHALDTLTPPSVPSARDAILRALPNLRGRDLACWCPEGPCHADVLIEMANAVPAEGR